MKISANSPCPCGSEKKYKKCCRVFHEGLLPSKAEELMRSRYSAFATKQVEYIIETTHKDNCDYTENTKAWKEAVEDFCSNVEFQRLDIYESIEGKEESYVTFRANLLQNNQDVSFTEKSRFLKVEGKWFYVDGTFLD